MNARHGLKTLLVAAAASMLLVQAPARAGEAAGNANWLAAATEKDAPAPPAGPQKPGVLRAISFSLDYTLATDYVWRGLNLSEFAGEGREKLNHQLGMGFEIDPAKLGAPPIGRFGGRVWFEWFGGQERLTPWSDNNLQEVRYQAWWAYDVRQAGLGVELGWIAYHYPRLRDSGSTLSGDGAYTHELYARLSFDDSKLFGRPMLNPAVTYYHDVDEVQAGFLIAQVSHDLALGKCWPNAPVLKDLTVTPSAALAVDHRYYDKAEVGSQTPFGAAPENGEIVDEPTSFTAKGTRLAYLQYGLAVRYDLSSALCIPKECGLFAITGFLNFTQSLHDSSRFVKDEFWGGVCTSWQW